MDLIGTEPAAAQPHTVDRPHTSRMSIGDHERRDIMDDPRQPSNHRVAADADVVTNGGAPADNRMVVNVHVTPEHDVHGQHALIGDARVVGDVHAGHQQIARTDASRSPIRLRRKVQGAVLTNDIVVADHQFGRRAVVFQVLWGLAERRMVVHDVACAQRGAALDDDVAVELGSGAETHVRADHATRSHPHVFREFRSGIDDRGGVDL